MTTASETRSPTVNNTVFLVLATLSVSHMLNDMMQSLIPSLYPMLKEEHGLDFGQSGLITLAFQLTASLFQPQIASKWLGKGGWSERLAGVADVGAPQRRRSGQEQALLEELAAARLTVFTEYVDLA